MSRVTFDVSLPRGSNVTVDCFGPTSFQIRLTTEVIIVIRSSHLSLAPYFPSITTKKFLDRFFQKLRRCQIRVNFQASVAFCLGCVSALSWKFSLARFLSRRFIAKIVWMCEMFVLEMAPKEILLFIGDISVWNMITIGFSQAGALLFPISFYPPILFILPWLKSNHTRFYASSLCWLQTWSITS